MRMCEVVRGTRKWRKALARTEWGKTGCAVAGVLPALRQEGTGHLGTWLGSAACPDAEDERAAGAFAPAVMVAQTPQGRKLCCGGRLGGERSLRMVWNGISFLVMKHLITTLIIQMIKKTPKDL